MFLNLFRPKWRHSDATIRSRAVNQLNAQNADEFETLVNLAQQDPSAEVRKSAISKIDSLSVFAKLLLSETDTDVMALLLTRLSQALVMTGQIKGAKSQLTPETHEILVTLLLESQAPAVHDTLFKYVAHQSSLATLALKSPLASTRQQAASALTNIPELEEVNKQSKGHDKVVFRITKDALNAHAEALMAAQAKQNKQNELLKSFSNLVDGQDKLHFVTRLKSLTDEWSNLNLDTQNDDYQTLVSKANAYLATLQEEEAAIQENKRQSDQLRASCEAHLNGLNVLVSSLTQQIQLEANPLSELNTQQNELNKVLRILTYKQDIPKLLELAQQQLDLLARYQQHSPNNDELFALPTSDIEQEKQLKRIQKIIKQIAWPSNLPLPLLLQQLEQTQSTLKQALEQTQTKNSEALALASKKLDQLTAFINAGETLNAQSVIDELTPYLNDQVISARIEKSFKSEIARLNELLEWQSFATQAKKEQLCLQMEALAENASLEPSVLAESIKELQKEWKQLDQQGAQHSRELWQRFHQASQEAYKPCDEHFKRLSQERAWNLSQRKAICEYLSDYFQHLDWTAPDWKAIDQIAHTAKQEWKRFTPVDRSPGKLVQQQFNELISQIDTKINAQKESCAEAKKNLLEQARELLDLEDKREAAEQVKRLQQQWKTVGTTFHSLERRLWLELREISDAVFAHLKQTQRQDNEKAKQVANQRQKQHQQHLQLLKHMAALCENTEVLYAESTLTPELCLEALNTLKSTSLPAPVVEGFTGRIKRVEGLLENPDALDTLLTSAQEEARLVCIRLEILKQQPSPEEDETLRMAYQMQRLQDSLDSASSLSHDADVTDLITEWSFVSFSWQFNEIEERFYELTQEHSLTEASY
ncbi:hypothetical protein DN062_01165 [Nitrincola tibetensis]|uniref:DUF349 domain-containing protein n=1 Tax=Nitrincola tibetensis TaxID=2219697 RepID=A0A364NRK8_9GAMM|nr:DUF349 domain-containing protein [Nitrincola tibetensis]RAU19723.1 hypothetical protein DN062_01165 [Nitrincola tibetensis]